MTILMSQQEFRQHLENAFAAGFDYDGYGYHKDGSPPPPDFDEWFDTNYGDIIELGKNRQESENLP